MKCALTADGALSGPPAPSRVLRSLAGSDFLPPHGLYSLLGSSVLGIVQAKLLERSTFLLQALIGLSEEEKLRVGTLTMFSGYVKDVSIS